MSDRFYVPENLDRTELELPADEAHHALHVLRKREGDRITLFNGRGCSAEARIVSTGRKSVRVAIETTSKRAELPRWTVTLGVAFPKGERTRWLVEKVTEIGVARLIPLKTERSVVEPGPQRIEKLRQSVVAACKQCGRDRLMEIEGPHEWTEWLGRHRPPAVHVVCDASGERFVDYLRDMSARADNPSGGEIVLSIGPEGGFSSHELAAAQSAGAELAALGESILRVETAAIVAAGTLIHCLPG